MSNEPLPQSEIILYQTEDGRTRIQCRFENETVWLTQALRAELFEVGVNTVNYHLKAIFAEGELRPEATIRYYRIVRTEGRREVAREIEHYNLDVILAIGFRVRSHRGTQFRQWAIGRLNEYLVKGFTMDDERLKNPPGKGQKDYFDEQLERIRDIRSSERRFYQKVLVSTPRVWTTRRTRRCHSSFSPQCRIKCTGRRTGRRRRRSSMREWMLESPSWACKPPAPAASSARRTVLAKNYLDGQELDTLNLIVTAYIEFAELRALQRKVMTMRDWITKLDEFLKLSEHELLDHAGKITAEQAKMKAELEYERYRVFLDSQPRAVDLDFEKAASELKKLPKTRNPKSSKP